MGNIFKQRHDWLEVSRFLEKNDILNAKYSLHLLLKENGLVFEKNSIVVLNNYYEHYFQAKTENPYQITRLVDEISSHCNCLLFHNPIVFFPYLRHITPILEKIGLDKDKILNKYLFSIENDKHACFSNCSNKDKESFTKSLKDPLFYMFLNKNKMYDMEELLNFAISYQQNKSLKSIVQNETQHKNLKL